MRHYITKSKSGHYTLTIRSDKGDKLGCYRKLPSAGSARMIWGRFSAGEDRNNMGFPFDRY